MQYRQRAPCFGGNGKTEREKFAGPACQIGIPGIMVSALGIKTDEMSLFGLKCGAGQRQVARALEQRQRNVLGADVIMNSCNQH